MATVTRKAAWRAGTPDGWPEDLIWFAAAVHQMKLLSPGTDEFIALALAGAGPDLDQIHALTRGWADPASWGYQSQVHGTFDRADQWPDHQGTRVLWQECAHNHWFFLPWHRAYLLEFEEIVRGHIRALDGPVDTWALPYWNYSDYRDDVRRLQLPLPLQGEFLPADVTVPGTTPDAEGRVRNPLFTPGRAITDDTPDPSVDPEPIPNPDAFASWADAGRALRRPHYANQRDEGAVSFGGGVLEDPLDRALFHGADEIGMLDAQPHGSTHNEVGGAMWLFESAGLDPAFWLHHCNVDRLWETYAQDLAHSYPFVNGIGVGSAAHASWETQEFRFLRPDGTISTWRAPDLTDLGALGYDYDTIAPPVLPPPPDPDSIPGSEDRPFGLNVPVSEPVAEAGPLPLAESVDLVLRSAPELANATLEVFSAARWLLVFDGIRADRPAQSAYDVFLGLTPDEAAESGDADHHAGVLSLFGAHEASREGSATDGTRRSLDVTDLVQAQAAGFRPGQATVRLVPLAPERDLAGCRVTVERITLEFS